MAPPTRTSTETRGALTANMYRAPRRVGSPRAVGPGGVPPPAEVDVVAHQGQVGVEPADLVPDVAADQHARRAHGQHRAVAVVLALVDLAGPHPGGTPPPRSPRRSFRSISLGPSTAVERLRLAALSICSSASGTGSQSSCRSQ